MIAASGVLVAVAAILLIAGLIGSGTALIYASILVTVVAAVLLVVGVLHRQGAAGPSDPRAGDPRVNRPGPAVPGTSGEDRDAAEPFRGDVAVGASRDLTAPTPPAPGRPPSVGAGGPASAGIVFVLVGQPDYHAEDCPRLAGDMPEPIEIEEAQDIGYAACPVCRPDDTVASPPAR